MADFTIGIAHDLPTYREDVRGIGFIKKVLEDKKINYRIIDVCDFSENELVGLDIVLNRSSCSYAGTVAFPNTCEKLGIRCINSLEGYKSVNKWVMYKKLVDNKVSTPKTVRLFYDITEKELSGLGSSVVIKPEAGEQGNGVFKSKNGKNNIIEKAKDTFLYLRGSNPDLSVQEFPGLLVQELIDADKVHKFCFIGDEIRAYFAREFSWSEEGGEIKGDFIIQEPSKELRCLALEARKHCLCETCQIDILSDGKNAYVLEFNAIFGLKGSKKANPNIEKELVEYAISAAKQLEGKHCGLLQEVH